MKRVKLKSKKAKIVINREYWDKGYYIKLFFKQNESYQSIRLMPDIESKLIV